MTKGEWVSYKALEGGLFYYQACRKRGEGRLLGHFAEKPALLAEAGKRLGAVPENLGDVSFRLTALPRIDLLLVFHDGDEEFPAELSLLFKDDIQNYLSLDDIAMLAGITAGRLIEAVPGA